MYIVHSSLYIERFKIAAIDSYLARKMGYIGTAKLVPCTIELFVGFVGSRIFVPFNDVLSSWNKTKIREPYPNILHMSDNFQMEISHIKN